MDTQITKKQRGSAFETVTLMGLGFLGGLIVGSLLGNLSLGLLGGIGTGLLIGIGLAFRNAKS